jgi:tetratricopeptide (TPR) repeat protein
MSRGKPPGKLRAATLAAFALIALASCASKPKAVPPPAQALPGPAAAATAAPAAPATTAAPAAPAAPAPEISSPPPPAAAGTALPISAPSTASAGAASAGTALKTADPASLARSREEREEIESSIVFGSPSSLAKARDLASKATAIKAEDASVLDSLAKGISALAYPEAAGSSDTAGGTAIAPDSAQGLPGALSQAAAGHSPEVPLDAAGSPLGELIPALVLFVSDSSDNSRRAFDALERFAKFGVPSIMPSILRGVDAERRGDWQGALGLYRSALAIAPDAWTAALGSGRALLALHRSGDALAVLSPLAQARSGLFAFDRVFALALYANGRYADADPYVSRVLTRDPQDSKFILIRARLLIRAKSYQQALPLLDAYGTVDPAGRLYILLRCLESEALRAREEALKWARRGLASYPDDPELLAAASRLLFAGPAFGRGEARTLALRVCEVVVPGAPAPADTDDETGAVLLASRQAAAVEASRLLALDAASRFKWTDAASYLARSGPSFPDKALAARILRGAGDARAELDYAWAWYRDEPGSEGAAEAYVRALVDSGDEKSAQEAIARIMPGASSPPFRSVLYLLQSKLQRSDEAALTLLHAALVEDADDPEALAAVSDIQLRRKDYAKARFYLRQAIAIDPGDPELEERQRQLDAASPP